MIQTQNLHFYKTLMAARLYPNYPVENVDTNSKNQKIRESLSFLHTHAILTWIFKGEKKYFFVFDNGIEV